MRTEIDYLSFKSDSTIEQINEFNEMKRLDLANQIQVLEHIEAEHRDKQVHYAMRTARFAQDDFNYSKFCMGMRDYHAKQAEWAKREASRLTREYDLYSNLTSNDNEQ